MQKESYSAETIAGQLKEFVQNFPELQAGERKLLVDALIDRTDIGQNKRVTLIMRSPFCSFGYFSPMLAPRGSCLNIILVVFVTLLPISVRFPRRQAKSKDQLVWFFGTMFDRNR